MIERVVSKDGQGWRATAHNVPGAYLGIVSQFAWIREDAARRMEFDVALMTGQALDK